MWANYIPFLSLLQEIIPSSQTSKTNSWPSKASERKLTIEQDIIEKFQTNIYNLKIKINKSTQHMDIEETNLKALTINLDEDITYLESTTTPLKYSIANWSICLILFIIIIFTLYYFYKQYRFQIQTLLLAFKIDKINKIRPILIKFFTDYKSPQPIENISPA